MKVSATTLQGLIKAVRAAGMAHGIRIEFHAEESADRLEVMADLTAPQRGFLTTYCLLAIRIDDLAREDWGNRRAIEHHVTQHFRRERQEVEAEDFRWPWPGNGQV